MRPTFLRLLVALILVPRTCRGNICVLPPFSFTFDATKNCDAFTQAVQSLNGVLAKQCSFAEPSPPSLDSITLQTFNNTNVAQSFEPTSIVNGMYLFEDIGVTNLVKVRLSMTATNVFGPISVDGIVQFDASTCSETGPEVNPFIQPMVWPWGTMTFLDPTNPSGTLSPTVTPRPTPTSARPTPTILTPGPTPTRASPTSPRPAAPSSTAAPSGPCFAQGTLCAFRAQCCEALSCRTGTRMTTTSSRKRCRPCLAQGTPCTFQGECCRGLGLRCHSSLLQCQPCGEDGARCNMDRDCCSNKSCNLTTQQCVAV